ncbi:MAG: glycoside hydrolase, partial [Candidatus Eisenbacteria bacterium]|nr:glycoside hydrolase [Candidatus Eisenbacteria bacterium]
MGLSSRVVARVLAAGTGLWLSAALAHAQVDERAWQDLRWRCIGPFRGGRTVAAVGVPGERHEFLIGVNHGGVWRTTDAGRTWQPIFDDQPTGSIGAIAVAPSNADVIYVGSGEGLQRPDLSVGDGVYRSDDRGRSWKHLGLEDGQQIPALAVDPRDPQRVFAAVLGHPYGANDTRGVYRSRDGGAHWERVLFRNRDTGAMDVLLAPDDARAVYAVLWSARQSPWEGGGGSFVRPEDNGLWKSNDGGDTWRALTAGLPSAADGLGRIGIAVAPSRPARLYAVVGARKGGGLYRSDDAGEHWQLMNQDPR